MYKHEGNSSFCFPFIGITSEVKNRLVSLFEKYGIEYRPIVGGNLLRQPYLKTKYEEYNNMPYADVLHRNGVYIGNNQFISDKDMDKLEQIVEKL
jgi:CDP-6-deoxy-D-xylo-4-hexulose-3-dehydrase